VGRKAHRRYLVVLGWCSIVLAIAAIAFNATVDPYGALTTPTYLGLNLYKPEQTKQVRLFKAIRLLDVRPNIIVLGSSRAELGIDPETAAAGASGVSYNAALSGANMHEIRAYFDHALANQARVERVVFGLDFFTFNQHRLVQPDFVPERLEKRHIIPQDWLRLLFSLAATQASFTTIAENQPPRQQISYTSLGKRSEQTFIRTSLPRQSIVNGFKYSLHKFLTDPAMYKDYELSADALAELADVVATCRDRQIDLHLFISPAHALQWEAIDRAGLWSVFEDWKRAVANIAPLWDFADYDAISTEPVSDRMVNYLDNSHYRERVGNWVLARLFKQGRTPENFGAWLTPATVEDRLQAVRRHRQQWRSQHASELAIFDNLRLTP